MADTHDHTPLEAALARVGDRWTLLAVQALLDGPRRFNELQESLPGIATNVLSQRLKHLTAEGLALARPYQDHPPRYAYELTAAGRELAGALRLLSDWGAAHAEDVEAARHGACGTPIEARWYCPTCESAVGEHDAEDLRYA